MIQREREREIDRWMDREGFRLVSDCFRCLLGTFPTNRASTFFIVLFFKGCAFRRGLYKIKQFQKLDSVHMFPAPSLKHPYPFPYREV